MKEYLYIIALAVILCLLIAICCLCLWFRRKKRQYNSVLMKNIREQDLLARQLEQTLVEKQTIEKVLNSHLTITADPPPDDDGPIVRIDITTLKPAPRK